MDASVSNAVSTSLYMNQAQTAQQAQMQVFREALDNQEQQVSALMESATAGTGSDQGSNLASEGNLGTQVNTYA
ncbi:putative motility protein [Vreelandella salicampi]|uniref:Putative motility protein n=1 Tax=Vreelandella salicampi TaxID=1449798 RepID=A0A7Z0RUP2_9GAMM|nr:putative motility protein [Halomonas salicampi]NYS60743.1 putative motility protein [Halomonas salicampi]